MLGGGKWIRKGILAVFDQGLFAGANFVVNILLANWLDPIQYGAFAVAYTVFLLLSVSYSSLIIEPLMIFGPGKYNDRIADYLSILFSNHWKLMGFISFLLILSSYFFSQPPFFSKIFVGLAFSSPFILFLWLIRGVLYVQIKPHYSFGGGLLYIILLVSGIVLFHVFQWLSSYSALILMGVVAGLVAIILSNTTRYPKEVKKKAIMNSMVIKEHWRIGKWLIVINVLTWIPGNTFIAILPAQIGMNGSAAFRAIINILMPILHFYAALLNLLLPQMVKSVKSNGQAGLHRLVVRTFYLFSGGAFLFFGFLYFWGYAAVQWLYGGNYAEYTRFFIIAGLIPVFIGISLCLGAALRVMEHLNLIFWSYALSAGSTITIGVWLSGVYGVGGAVIGMLLSTGLGAGLMIYFYIKLVDIGTKKSNPVYLKF